MFWKSFGIISRFIRMPVNIQVLKQFQPVSTFSQSQTRMEWRSSLGDVIDTDEYVR